MRQLLKSAYAAIPFKHQMFSLLKKVWIPSFYGRLWFDAAFRVAIPDTPGFLMQHHNRWGVETTYFWFGIDKGWESASIAAWIALCRDADVILDIGAAEGIYSLVAKCLRPSSRVLAFEPLPGAFNVLENNMRLNNYDVECLPMALSDFTGRARFYVDSPLSNEGSLVQGGSRHDAQTVDVSTLAEVIRSRGLDQLNLVKIDVEGAEAQVFRGMEEYLQRFRPSILVEVLNDDIGRDIEDMVGALNYKYYDLNDDFRKGPLGLRGVLGIRKATCLNYLLLQPEVALRLGLQ